MGTALLSWALHLFLVCQLLLAATDRASFFENSDIPFDMDVPGNTGTYDSGYILQLGFIMMLPLFVARWAEEGFATALAEFVSQTFAGKPLFGLFSMRTNMHYLDLGLRLGQASYIATGRTYTTMISNFTTLYSMYARSHFYFAAELLLLTGGWAVLARNPPGMEVWPGVLYAGSLLLSPWLFSPASFRFLSIRESYVEFIMWLDDRPGIPLTVGKGSYKDWHEALIKPQRGRSGRHAILMLLSRHVPVRVVVYLCCASALVVDAFPNSRPAHRALILAEASALFVTFGVLYYFVVDHRLLRRGILPQSIWAHFAFCWTVRVGTFILYYSRSSSCTRRATAPRTRAAATSSGRRATRRRICSCSSSRGSPCSRSSPTRSRGSLRRRRTRRHTSPTHCCGTHSDASWTQRTARHASSSPRSSSLYRYSDFWFREADTWVGTALFLTLKVIAVLPIAYVHSKLLFNEGYAASLARVARSRALVAEVHALVSLRAGFFFHLLLRVLSSFGRLLCVLCMPWRRGEEEEQPSFEPTVAGLPALPRAPRPSRRRAAAPPPWPRSHGRRPRIAPAAAHG